MTAEGGSEVGSEIGSETETLARSLQFVAPRRVDVSRGPVERPAADEVQVETTLSAISPGTELLVYRDEVPDDLPLDESIDELGHTSDYPFPYGYALVGTVTAAGADAAEEWLGRRVFAFHPHTSHVCLPPEKLVPIPPGVADEDAVLLAMVETAVSLVMDGRPRLGERVAVFGQGVVGLLTTALLSRFPLSELVTFDRYETRRDRSRSLGADRSLAPDDAGTAFDAGDGRADITYEVSGNPDALDAALETTGENGRVVVGSWYGSKPTSLDLGGRFHRSHIRIQSSQVSRIDHAHADRWDSDRRMALVLDLLSELSPSELVTHRVPVEDAADAYRLLDRSPDAALQVLLEY